MAFPNIGGSNCHHHSDKNQTTKIRLVPKGISLFLFLGHTEPTHEREESQACLSYPEREGGRRSQITESTEILSPGGENL